MRCVPSGHATTWPVTVSRAARAEAEAGTGQSGLVSTGTRLGSVLGRGDEFAWLSWAGTVQAMV